MWKINRETATCIAKSSPGVNKLTRAIVDAKYHLGGNGGGAFIINEFGHILVPSTIYSQKRIHIGRIEGRILFINPLNDSIIDLSDDKDLEIGSEWDKPYVGCQFRLSRYDEIYLIHEYKGGRKKICPEIQDDDLIADLRSVRSYGAMTFIVNPYGIVITKSYNKFNREWKPAYAGRINKKKWFKEEVNVSY